MFNANFTGHYIKYIYQIFENPQDEWFSLFIKLFKSFKLVYDTDDQTLHSPATVNGHWRWISLNYQPTCSKCWKSQAWQLHLLCFHQTLNNHLPPGSSHVTGFGDGCRVDVVNKSTAKLRHFLRCCHSQSMF